jgi:hypothetical protein
MVEETSSLPTPVPVAFLLCDQISVDSTSGKKTIVGIFDRMWVGRFPTNYRPASLYARVIDCEGEYEVRVEFVQVSTQAVLGKAGGALRSNNRHAYTDLVLPWPVIPIPAPGEYEFRLWMNNKFINSIRFTAQPRTEMESQS